MNTNDGSTDWRLLHEFAAVDLTQSFVLSWEVESEALLIDIDVVLRPEHPLYEEPRPSQKTCIRPAVIEFPLCDRIESDSVSANRAPVEVAVELGHGAIEGFRRLADGCYEISGIFGVVLIEAGRPIMRIKEP